MFMYSKKNKQYNAWRYRPDGSDGRDRRAGRAGERVANAEAVRRDRRRAGCPAHVLRGRRQRPQEGLPGQLARAAQPALRALALLAHHRRINQDFRHLADCTRCLCYF